MKVYVSQLANFGENLFKFRRIRIFSIPKFHFRKDFCGKCSKKLRKIFANLFINPIDKTRIFGYN